MLSVSLETNQGMTSAQAKLIISRFCHILIITAQSIIQTSGYRNYNNYLTGFTNIEDDTTVAHSKQTELEGIVLAKAFSCISNMSIFSSQLDVAMKSHSEICNVISSALSCYSWTSTGTIYQTS